MEVAAFRRERETTAERAPESRPGRRAGSSLRAQVQVEQTQPHCELWLEQQPLATLENVKDRIMPTDELIATDRAVHRALKMRRDVARARS